MTIALGKRYFFFKSVVATCQYCQGQSTWVSLLPNGISVTLPPTTPRKKQAKHHFSNEWCWVAARSVIFVTAVFPPYNKLYTVMLYTHIFPWYQKPIWAILHTSDLLPIWAHHPVEPKICQLPKAPTSWTTPCCDQGVSIVVSLWVCLMSRDVSRSWRYMWSISAWKKIGGERGWGWVVPLPSNSGKWRFTGIPY